jgi:hypothetical protein
VRAISLPLLGLALLAWVPQAPAQGEVPPAAQEVLKQFEEETADIARKVEAQLQERREKVAAELKKVQDQFCKEAKLDEAVAVRDLIRSLRAGTDAAPNADLPAAAREVVKQYEDEAAEIQKKADAEVDQRREKLTAELKNLQDLFCKDAKLDEAVAVRDLIRATRDGVSDALPDPGYINNGPGDIGKVLYYDVTGVDNGQSIWGSDIYTTGSHLGMAAVHCGLLKAGERGVVKVSILPAQQSYAASTRHGVTSFVYGPWGVSFKVERAYGLGRKRAANALPDPGTLVGHRAEVGKTLLFEVTGSDSGAVWGTDIYTDDSSLAAAAVHAGAVAAGQKGVVKVTVLPGQDSYPGSPRNGVTSGSWGNWVGSFRVERVK